MCNSKAAGGQRCFGHAAKRLARVEEQIIEVAVRVTDGKASIADRIATDQRRRELLAEYASTTRGAADLQTRLETRQMTDDDADRLAVALVEGAFIRERNAAVLQAGKPTTGRDTSSPTPAARRAADLSGGDRIAWFTNLGGNRKTVTVAELTDLGIDVAPSGRLGGGSFSFTGTDRTVPADQTLRVRQGRVKKAVVLSYVEQMQTHGTSSVPPIVLTDRPADGHLWHLDGLHRLVAARILDQPIKASIWR